MRIKIKKGILLDTLVNHYFFIALGVYFITMLNMSFRPGVVMSVVLGVILLLCIIKHAPLCNTDLWVLLYVVYNLASFLWVGISGLSISVFFQEVITSILPITIYYGMRYADKERLCDDIRIAVLLCVLIGIVLFITVPEFYRDYAYFEGFAASNRAVHVQQGLSSYIGRIPLGTYTVVAGAISLDRYVRTNERKDLVLLVLFLCASILTAQRSSWFGSVLLIILLFYLMVKNKQQRTLLKICGILILTSVLFFAFINRTSVGVIQITTKSLSIFGAIRERFSSWSNLFSNTNLIIGRGLGTGGHRARVFSGYDTVTDGNYIKMLGEIGIVGIVLFLILTVSALRKLKKSENKLAIFIIVFILLQCIGSNIIALQVTAPLFWMAIGFYKTSSNELSKTVQQL